MRRMDRRGDRGAVAVELGLLLPILMLLLFGIIEFGIIFNRYTSVAHSAREGVRQLSIGNEAEAVGKAEASAPDLGDKIVCTIGAPVDAGDVKMTCSYDYKLSLWVFTKPVKLESTAVMRKE